MSLVPVGLDVDVLACERVVTGGRRDLVRATVQAFPEQVAGAELMIRERGRRPTFAAMPGPPRSVSRRTTVTLGFAVPAQLQADSLALILAGGILELPRPAVRSVSPARPVRSGAMLAAQTRALELASALGRADDELVRLRATLDRTSAQLDAKAAQLESSRAVGLRLKSERDEARALVARAAVAEYEEADRPRASGTVSMPAGPAISARRTAGALAVVCGAVLIGLLTWPAGPGSRGGDRAPAHAAATPKATARAAADPRARPSIPVGYLALYRRAAQRYGLEWPMLAAVGAVESRHGAPNLAGVPFGANGRGAKGPAQFLAATWSRYGLDGNADGKRDPHDPADAIPAMASYLRASGAPEDWARALRSYNHSDAYVAEVLQQASRYRAVSGGS
jgi:hypothetical protein